VSKRTLTQTVSYGIYNLGQFVGGSYWEFDSWDSIYGNVYLNMAEYPVPVSIQGKVNNKITVTLVGPIGNTLDIRNSEFLQLEVSGLILDNPLHYVRLENVKLTDPAATLNAFKNGYIRGGVSFTITNCFVAGTFTFSVFDIYHSTVQLSNNHFPRFFQWTSSTISAQATVEFSTNRFLDAFEFYSTRVI